jgi:multimeric flavodoxin WrbA
MTIKILGICGSPRDGNTLAMLKNALEVVNEMPDAESSLITLKGKIGPCVDCDKCPIDPPKKFCSISDKMDEIYPKLIEADGIILGSPVYFGTVTSQTKAFMDRCRPLVRAGMLLRSKVGGAIAVGGIRHGGQEKTISAIIDYFLLVGILPVGLQSTLEFGACGVAWRAGKIKEDFWDFEFQDRKMTAFEEARELGKLVAMWTKVVKAGLKVFDPRVALDSFKITR